MSGGTGLAAELTFDENTWYSISGGILSDTRVLANTFLAAPQKNGGKASLKNLFAESVNSERGAGGGRQQHWQYRQPVSDARQQLAGGGFLLPAGGAAW